MSSLRKALCLLMAVCVLWMTVPAMADSATDALFDSALAAFQTPAG